jgi:hypothetical protein
MPAPNLFISHASEDKESFVHPLAHALKNKGIPLWYDKFSLRAGDSLRRSIDRGLAECTAGLVVLSPAFFLKAWPQRELDALYSAEIAGRTRLLPIWHKLGLAEVAAASPLLADRVAIQSIAGVDAVAAAVAALFPVPPKVSGARLAELLETFFDGAFYSTEARYKGCEYRFLQLNAYKQEWLEAFEEAIADIPDDDAGELPEEIETRLESEKERIRMKHRIPEDVYLVNDEPIDEDDSGTWLESFCGWASGTLSREESAELIGDIDHEELDEYYILLELPNFSISSAQRPLLERGLVEIGCGYETDYEAAREVCRSLRALD